MSTSRTSTPVPSASTSASGVLAITVHQAKDLSLPPNVALPEAIEKLVKSQSGVSMASSLGQNGVMGHRHKESVQRKQSWFLPYVVLEVSPLLCFQACLISMACV